LESFSYLDWSFNLLLGQEDSRDDFSEIARAFMPLLISINRPLNIEKRHCYLEQIQRKTSWRLEELKRSNHGRRPSQKLMNG